MECRNPQSGPVRRRPRILPWREAMPRRRSLPDGRYTQRARCGIRFVLPVVHHELPEATDFRFSRVGLFMKQSGGRVLAGRASPQQGDAEESLPPHSLPTEGLS